MPGETQNERKLRLAQWIENDPNTGLEMCAVCHHSYNSRHKNSTQAQTNRIRLLLDHIEEIHIKLEAYPCHYCDKRFRTKTRRNRHIHDVHQIIHKMAKMKHI